MRHLLTALLMLGLLAPTFAVAQNEPPVPRPRPDRGDVVSTPANAPAPPADNAQGDGVPILDEPPAASALSPAAALPDTPATAAINSATASPQPVVLTAQVTENGGNIPEGLVWRIFDTKTDAAGELALVAKSDEAMASFTLAPGQYLVHVAYGRAQTSDTLDVVEGGNSKQIVIDAGGLRLNAAIVGDIPISPAMIRFDVLTAGADNDRQMVAEAVLPNDVLTLNSGTYHVVSHFGSINAVVRADLRVEAGQLTDATLFHKASEVAFKLVTEAGGEAIADVEWTVKTEKGETIFTELGAVPTTVLAEGDYLVLAKRGDKVFNREFAVLPGQPQDVEVLSSVY